MALAYEFGEGVNRDQTASIEWYRKAAEQGFALAQFNLGVAYENGNGVTQDYATADAWYRKAADQGLRTAQLNMGYMLLNGLGTPRNFVEAYKWLTLVERATASPPEMRAMAQRNLAKFTRQMTPAEIAEGQRLATEWKPSNPNVIQGDGGRTTAAAPNLIPEKELDALFAAEKWDEMATAIEQAHDGLPLLRALVWLNQKVEGGAGCFVASQFAKAMWLQGNLRGNGNEQALAGSLMLYALALIAIDGPKCEDQSAPSHRMDQSITGYRSILGYLKSQPTDVKTKMLAEAMAMEARTASKRKNDELLCHGGLEEMRVSLERGTQRNLGPKPGYVGTVVDTQPPPDWKPSFLSPEQYGPAQEKARSQIEENLKKLIQ
jgi:hypothetical protein